MLTPTFKSLLAQLERIRSRALARRAMERATPTPYGTFHVLPKDYEAIEADQQLQLEQLRLELAEEKRLAPGSQGQDD